MSASFAVSVAIAAPFSINSNQLRRVAGDAIDWIGHRVISAALVYPLQYSLCAHSYKAARRFRLRSERVAGPMRRCILPPNLELRN